MNIPNTIGETCWCSRIDHKLNLHWSLIYLNTVILLCSCGSIGSTVEFDSGNATRLSIRSVGDDASPDRADNLGEVFLESRENLMLEVRFPKIIDLKFRRCPTAQGRRFKAQSYGNKRAKEVGTLLLKCP